MLLAAPYLVQLNLRIFGWIDSHVVRAEATL